MNGAYKTEHNHHHGAPVRLSAGFSLMELLVSLVVLAVGLLSLASLHAFAIQYNHSAQLRSFAVSQLNAMSDRMRANKIGVQAGHYDNLSGTPSGPPSCGSCTPVQTATRDLYEWNSNNNLLLPSGQGRVIANGSRHTITVFWDNDKSGATGVGCSNNPTVDLTCVRMDIEL